MQYTLALRLFFFFTLGLISLGCVIGRTYEGSPVRTKPDQILSGKSTKTDILALFGPPEEILKQQDGFIFVYRYQQTNMTKLLIQEPVFSRKKLFYFEKSNQREDALVILFTQTGIVQNYGFGEETPHLSTF